MNLFMRIAPFLAATGNELVNFDSDSLGGDDFAGALLIYTAEAGTAVEIGGDIPELPELLRNGISDKISPKAKLNLRIASAVLTLAQFQVVPGSRTQSLLKYVNQAIRALIADKPVPAPNF
jgi:hypothetical protein